MDLRPWKQSPCAYLSTEASAVKKSGLLNLVWDSALLLVRTIEDPRTLTDIPDEV